MFEFESMSKTRYKYILLIDKIVGWLYWGFKSILRYFSHIATWKQEITNLWYSSGETGNLTQDLLLRRPGA